MPCSYFSLYDVAAWFWIMHRSLVLFFWKCLFGMISTGIRLRVLLHDSGYGSAFHSDALRVSSGGQGGVLRSSHPHALRVAGMLTFLGKVVPYALDWSLLRTFACLMDIGPSRKLTSLEF